MGALDFIDLLFNWPGKTPIGDDFASNRAFLYFETRDESKLAANVLNKVELYHSPMQLVITSFPFAIRYSFAIRYDELSAVSFELSEHGIEFEI